MSSYYKGRCSIDDDDTHFYELWIQIEELCGPGTEHILCCVVPCFIYPGHRDARYIIINENNKHDRPLNDSTYHLLVSHQDFRIT